MTQGELVDGIEFLLIENEILSFHITKGEKTQLWLIQIAKNVCILIYLHSSGRYSLELTNLKRKTSEHVRDILDEEVFLKELKELLEKGRKETDNAKV